MLRADIMISWFRNPHKADPYDHGGSTIAVCSRHGIYRSLQESATRMSTISKARCTCRHPILSQLMERLDQKV